MTSDDSDRTERTITLDPDLPPWHQQPGEGDTAYAHFRTHLEAGPHRRLTKTSEKLTLAYGTVRYMSSVYRWRERCRAWDTDQDAERDERRSQARLRAWEEDERIIRAAKGILGRKMQDMDPTELSNGEAVSLFREIFRAERLLHGEPTETVAHTGPGGGELQVQVSEMTPEARATRLRELAQQADRMAHAALVEDDED